jgi:hypothetical protein
MRRWLRPVATRFVRAKALPTVRSVATDIAARDEPREPLMISRLTAYAAVFAVLSAATITFASNATLQTVGPAPVATAASLPVVQLERVEVIGRRAALTQR